MKRFVAVFLIALMIFTFASCSKKNDTDGKENSEGVTEESVVNSEKDETDDDKESSGGQISSGIPENNPSGEIVEGESIGEGQGVAGDIDWDAFE